MALLLSPLATDCFHINLPVVTYLLGSRNGPVTVAQRAISQPCSLSWPQDPHPGRLVPVRQFTCRTNHPSQRLRPYTRPPQMSTAAATDFMTARAAAIGPRENSLHTDHAQGGRRTRLRGARLQLGDVAWYGPGSSGSPAGSWTTTWRRGIPDALYPTAPKFATANLVLEVFAPEPCVIVRAASGTGEAARCGRRCGRRHARAGRRADADPVRPMVATPSTRSRTRK